ncbi:MAG: hypothetical protein U0836_00815 [Pirellulales bacterium]
MSKLPLIRLLPLALVVALGVAVAWGSLTGFVLGMVQQSRSRNEQSDQLCVTRQGEPVIYRSQTKGDPIVLLDLDGKPLANQSANDLAYLNFVSSGPLASWLMGVPWRSRLVAEMVPQVPRSAWYLIHDGQVNGRAYGVGYDLGANRPMAYFSRQGFSQELPDRADWFEVKGSDGLNLATTELFGIPYWPGDGQMTLLADGKLWQIDLGGRSVRVLREAPDAVAVAKIDRAAPTEQPPPVRSSNPEPLESRLALRFSDAIEVIDPKSGDSIRYQLPADWSDNAFRALQLADDRLLIDEYHINEAGESRIVWLDRAGKVVDERVLAGQRRRGASAAEACWTTLLVTPIPSTLYAFALLAPTRAEGAAADGSYASGFAKTASQIWPSVLLVTLIGLALAIAAYRRQKQFGLPGAAAWAVFCFALGVPGWLAYRFLWPWPPLGACPSCEHTTPVDRPACLDCGRSFPPPRLTGAEVFA